MPIGITAHSPAVIIARKDFPAKDMKEFVAVLKEKGDALKQGHGGIGASSHMACVLFNAAVGTKPTLVAYRGSAPALNDVVGGHIDFLCEQSVSVAESVLAGSVKAYGDRCRRSAWRSCRTCRPPRRPASDYEMSVWAGMFAPKGTPPEVIAKLADALDKSLDEPAVRDRLAKLGGSIPAKAERSPAAFDRSCVPRSPAGRRSSPRPPKRRSNSRDHALTSRHDCSARWPAAGAARRTADALVVLLHGYGANGDDLIALADGWRRRLPNAVFVAPNAPETIPGMPGSLQWFPLTLRDPTEYWRGVVAAGLPSTAFSMRSWRATGCAPDRLVLVGFSQGTMLALHVGLRRAVAPAAIVGFSGLLAGPEHLAEASARPPILLIHGEMDDLIPVDVIHIAREPLAERRASRRVAHPRAPGTRH